MHLLFQLIQMESNCDVNGISDLKNLAKGPDRRVCKYPGCIINGHRFRTMKRDANKNTQNSGIVVKGDHNGEEIYFFGVLKDVIELSYLGQRRVFIFKCDWWDIGHKRGRHIDEYQFLSVNVSRTWYKDDPYILANQAEEVIYIPNTKLGRDWRVVERVQPRNIYDVNVMARHDDAAPDPFQQHSNSNAFDVTDTVDDSVHPLTRTDMEGRYIHANEYDSIRLNDKTFTLDNENDEDALDDSHSE